MVFGFFGKKGGGAPEPEEDEEIELVAFKGATNNFPVDMKQHAKLVQAALEPAREMVTDALVRRAELLRLDIKGDRAQIVLQVDGMPYSGGKLPKPQAVGVTQVLKLLAGLDPKLKTEPQQGGIKAEFQTLPYELQISTQPQPDGSERLLVAARNTKVKMEQLVDDLGYPPAVKLLLREIATKKQGFVLATGAPGTGTTTLLYALMRCVDVYLYNIFSIANLGGRELVNITKFECNPEDSVSTTIARIMRAEGDIVFVDPVKTSEQAKELVSVADQITLVTETPGRDAASGIIEFAKLVGDNEKSSQLLQGIFSQRLIRLLCTECREAFRPNSKLLGKVGLPPETRVLYRKGEPTVDEKTGEESPPCEKCGGIGYFGRVGMLEYIIPSDGMRQLLARGAMLEEVRAQARADGAQSLQKDGMRLVAEGKTSLEELQRIFKPA